jgi:putative effector of murein hydrolase
VLDRVGATASEPVERGLAMGASAHGIGTASLARESGMSFLFLGDIGHPV